MDAFTTTLMNIMNAGKLEDAASLTLAAVAALLQPQWACLLLWDKELGRHTVGDTWLRDANSGQASEIRRRALHLAQVAHDTDLEHARQVEPGIRYEPLNASGEHVGALVYAASGQSAPADRYYELLLRGVSRALYTATRLQLADQERAQLEAERSRLEELLRAVEQQQRTIDQLLAAERQFSASLEAKVEERTAALREAQARLVQSEKLAVIGQLASSLAHELNNPLQAIQSGLGLVMNEIDSGNSDHIREDLRIIQQELERIATIFRQMLDFYRPVSHEYAPLDLNAICEGARVLMRKRLQEAHIALRLDLARQLPLTCGDSNQVKQVLLNLMLNAAEALAVGGGNITLRTRHNGHEVCLSVADDGPGIPTQHQARLFEPLFTTKTRGLGLGLAISREIVQHHDGSIVVESTPGIGTTFTVFLPVRKNCHEQQ